MMLRSASTPSLASSLTETKQKLPCATHIQRAQSAGNLEEIFNISASPLSRQSSKRLSRRNTLEDEDDGQDKREEGEWSQLLSVQKLAARELKGFCDMGIFSGEGKMYLAAGIGVNFLDEGGFGGGAFTLALEKHYKNMLLQCPGNPLFLRNYAYFLHQTKGDLVGAEEYYSRAILADPEDGEILCGYGKVIWELYGDKERARSYFERALRASSQDSNINASYVSFLWDAHEDEDEDELEDQVKKNVGTNPARFMLPGIMASATA